MPLMRVDVIKGHDEAYLKKLLDIAYEVQLATFGTPQGDRYQVLTQHEPFEMQILDTGLGIERSKDIVVFNLVSRPRTTKAKVAFYDQ
ncbi:tautomerase family protein, partial [Weissella soli]